MIRIGAVLIALFLILPATAARPADNPLLGTWKLKSYVREVTATGERIDERGEHPNGYLSYAVDGRMYAIITWENRIKPREVVPTDEERVKLFSTMISYAGTYTFDAEKVIHHVDISWNQNWTGNRSGALLQARRQHAHHHHAAEQKLRRRTRGPQHPGVGAAGALAIRPPPRSGGGRATPSSRHVMPDLCPRPRAEIDSPPAIKEGAERRKAHPTNAAQRQLMSP